MLQEIVEENTYTGRIRTIKSEIADLVETQKARRRDNPQWTSGLNQQKMTTRWGIRIRHLAVAYMKGKSYLSLEKKSQLSVHTVMYSVALMVDECDHSMPSFEAIRKWAGL